MKSIRNRMVIYFIFIIVITVIFLEMLLISIVRQNYYKNVELSLLNQAKVSSDLYIRYFTDSTLYDNVLNNVDTFWKQSTAQVEIIDNKGRVLMDSIGTLPKNGSPTDDVKEALKGETGVWKGNVNYDSEEVMAVSYPLKDQNKILGVLRFITSLREVNKEIIWIEIVFIGIGVIVVFLSAVLSLFLANTIVNPVKEVTRAAEKMATGNFSAQSKKKYDDEIGKLSDTLNYMAGEILKKDLLKNEFISSVSHELRTPLTSIKGWAITLKEIRPEDKSLLQDGLDIIEKESDRLTLMVEELLDFSKFVSGKIEIYNVYVGLSEIMEHLKKQLMPRAKREDIDLEIVYEENTPLMYTDENRLKQLFINILDNSFKFTLPGGNIIFSSSFKNEEFIFDIKDTGAGISKEELPKVKEKFYKGKSSKSKNGIGLSICDEIVKMMKGSFEISSELGKGTDVRIILPLLKEDQE